MNEKIVNTLLKLGFTEYEAKVYIAIIQLNLSSAREIINISEIPRGKIYSILNQLVEKGYVAQKPGSPALYHAIDPVEVITSLKKQLIEDLSEIEEYIVDINKRNCWGPSHFWEVPMGSELDPKFYNMVKGAENDILILLKEPEIYPLIEAKLVKIRQKIKVTIIVPKDLMHLENKFHLYEINDELKDYLDHIENSFGRNSPTAEIAFMMLIDGKKAVVIVKKSQELMAGISYDSVSIYTQKKLIEMLTPEI